MKRKIAAVLLLAACCALTACAPQGEDATDSLLAVLDQTIADKATYAQIRQRSIDSLEGELSATTDIEQRLTLSTRIFNLYFDFQNDRAMEYALSVQDLARKLVKKNPSYLWRADINMVRLLRSTGRLKESTELLDEIPGSELPSAVRYQYLTEQMSNYGALRDNSPSPEYKLYYDMVSEAYRDSVLMYPGRTASLLVRVEQLRRQKNTQEALRLLHEEYDTLDPYSKRAGTLAYNIALTHEVAGDREDFVRYLTLSSIADIRGGARGYKSLQRLAIVMYESGEIDRPYTYMKCAIEDAIASSARLRAQEASEIFVIIDESYQQKVAGQKQVILNSLIIMAVVGVMLLVSLFIISKQNTRLAGAKRKLSEVNSIKDGYLGVFIEEYSKYLSKMNASRVKFTKILKKGDLDEIGKFVDGALNTTDDHKELYRKFDQTILHIFPTFVEEFNQLMTDRAAQKSDPQELTAEQRIAAFIRLGIKDTDKIALFLRYSLRTVYNYQSQMRSKAKNPKTLREDIMLIGGTK